MNVWVEDRVQYDPFDGRQGRVRAGAEHVGQHVVQVVDGKSARHLVFAPTTLHLDEVGLNHVAILCTDGQITDRRATVNISNDRGGKEG